jgi:hypothetical protein
MIPNSLGWTPLPITLIHGAKTINSGGALSPAFETQEVVDSRVQTLASDFCLEQVDQQTGKLPAETSNDLTESGCSRRGDKIIPTNHIFETIVDNS